jgi:hypothetical protein
MIMFRTKWNYPSFAGLQAGFRSVQRRLLCTEMEIDSDLLYSARSGDLARLKLLLADGARTRESESSDDSQDSLLKTGDAESENGVMLVAASCRQLSVVRWLLEYGGVSITEATEKGETIWDLLEGSFVDYNGEWNDAIPGLKCLLRVMVLQGAPPDELAEAMSPRMKQVVEDGARLRARLPAYLARRRELLNLHCPVLAPLRDLILGYEEPTTDELWATGLFGPEPFALTPPQCAMLSHPFAVAVPLPPAPTRSPVSTRSSVSLRSPVLFRSPEPAMRQVPTRDVAHRQPTPYVIVPMTLVPFDETKLCICLFLYMLSVLYRYL